MKIRKAIITSAGKGQRTIPLQTFVDRDGKQKSALQILIEEATSSGVEEIGVVICPGDRDAYQHAAGDHAGRLQFIEQGAPRGYGHALYAAKSFAGAEPFLHLVSDHLPLSTTDKRCAQQLVEVATAENCSVSAVQPTRETMLAHFGAVGGTRVPKRQDLYEVENVLEKPTPTEAEQSLIVPGLRAGYYLCFFGMHVLTPVVMEILEELDSQAGKDGKFQLSPALAKLAGREKYLALQVQGRRYDMGGKYGLLFAQLALALDGSERDEVLAQMVELLAARKSMINHEGTKNTKKCEDEAGCEMSVNLIDIIQSDRAEVRNRALESAVAGMSTAELLQQCEALDGFRRTSTNLYERVRALFFLAAIHRFHLPLKEGVSTRGLIPFEGYTHLLSRRFEEAIDVFLNVMLEKGPSDAISSALSSAYKELAFATLANQVRRSVRSVKGNQWMFRIGHGADQPLRIRPELLKRSDRTGLYPILAEKTPVRMDLSHSGWSDIFFLGMDFPEGARVLNISIDLAVYGRDKAPRPPVEAYLRVIDAPVLRLVSVDLGADAEISSLSEVYDFARDYLGLLKAAIIAAGIVPPGLEGSGLELKDLLAEVVGPGLGLEVVSSVNNIPKGSRLAVSTNLLAGLISVCMRATGQAKSLTGQLQESERRLVAARAILGEWIGGSGGGWQDSGGVWPGMKLITGAAAGEGDPEMGTSRGRLLPNHRILDQSDCSDATRQKLQDSLVLVHGGMAQNVGPILEMVTEKYLVRGEKEWKARHAALSILDDILAALKRGDVKAVGAATTRNFFEPLQTIIPWASNFYTETLIRRTREKFGDAFQGFWMLGGMSGGGMGFIFDPSRKKEAQIFLQDVMSRTRRELQDALPFAMEPVVYDFAINPRGTWAELLADDRAVLPSGYYARVVPGLLRTNPRDLSPLRRAELDRFGAACRTNPELAGMVQTLFDRLFPRVAGGDGAEAELTQLLEQNGFDSRQHEQIRKDLRNGRIGLAQNRLPANTIIEDVQSGDVIDAQNSLDSSLSALGQKALAAGSVAVISLAAGVGSRWTQGAGVVKALHPFAKLAGKHRSFVEVHLAKSRRTGNAAGVMPAHVITTSYLTHDPIANYLRANGDYGYTGPLHLSPGRSIGLRLIPMVRDLRFHWEETPQKIQDEQKQKMIESGHAALIGWAQAMGEGNDYTDNLPHQCLHPVGHWYEIPNLLLNGVLETLLRERPNLRYLMLHNIDTLGADLDPALLGLHIQHGSCLSFEVITRRIDDRGGGLARVNGQPRLVEGLAMPREEEEFNLSYYNSMTTWIDLEQLLAVFKLDRNDLGDKEKVAAAVREVAGRMQTYITLKEVKKRWGHGQEDVYPVTQWEKLWSDMSSLAGVNSAFFVVPRRRGQQLKEQAQLDGWLRDGSAAYVEALCDWS